MGQNILSPGESVKYADSFDSKGIFRGIDLVVGAG